MLKRSLEMGEWVWPTFVCLKLGTSGWLLWTQQWIFRFHERHEISYELSDSWFLKKNSPSHNWIKSRTIWCTQEQAIERQIIRLQGRLEVHASVCMCPLQSPPAEGEWPLVARSLCASKRKPLFKICQNLGKKQKCGHGSGLDPKPRLHCAGEAQQQSTGPTESHTFYVLIIFGIFNIQEEIYAIY